MCANCEILQAHEDLTDKVLLPVESYVQAELLRCAAEGTLTEEKEFELTMILLKAQQDLKKLLEDAAQAILIHHTAKAMGHENN